MSVRLEREKEKKIKRLEREKERLNDEIPNIKKGHSNAVSVSRITNQILR